MVRMSFFILNFTSLIAGEGADEKKMRECGAEK